MTTDRPGPPGPVQPVPVQPVPVQPVPVQPVPVQHDPVQPVPVQPVPVEHDPVAPGPPGLTAEILAAPGAPSRPEVRLAVFSYLGVAIAGILPPLAVYLVSRRRSAFAREHAAQALRVTFAVILYGICALIIATMLALDSVEVAVIVVSALALALWLVMVVFLVRAARAAGRGEPYEFPGWLWVSPRK